MNKENRDDKLRTFLRTHKPDVPREAQGFEERLLDATVRRHWRSRLSKMLSLRKKYVLISVGLAVVLVISFFPSLRDFNKSDSPVAHVTQSPTVAIVQAQKAEISDEDALLFLADSLALVSANTDHDLISTLDAL